MIKIIDLTPNSDIKQQIANFNINAEYSSVDNLKASLAIGGHSQESYLLFHGITKIDIDLNYFLSLCNDCSSIALKYEINNNQNLITLDKKNNLLNHGPLSGEYHDGYNLAGIYFFNCTKDILSFIENGFKISAADNFVGIPTPFFSPSSKNKTAVLFLDRDGILNVDINYLYKNEDVILYEDAVPLIKFANEKNWPVIIVSNQSGVARDFFSEKDVNLLHSHLEHEFKKRGVHITKWLYCPFHFEEGIQKYKKHSLLRKPHPGMILKSGQYLNIDIEKSFMVGDKVSDQIILPKLNTLLLRRQYSLENASAPIFDNYQQIMEHILKNI